eukprot:403334788
MMRWRNKSDILYPECFSFLIFAFTYHGKVAWDNKKQTGKYFSKEQSVFYKKSLGDKNGQELVFNWGNFIAMFLRAFVMIIAMSTTTLISYYSKKAGASFSVMSSILALASFFTAVLFYILYKEKLYLRHLMGMLCLIICVAFIAISKQLKLEDSEQYQQLLASGVEITPLYVPIAFALFQCINFTLASLFLRIAIKHGYTTLQFSVDFHLTASIFFLLGFIYTQLYTDDPFTFGLCIYIIIAGVAITSALTFLNFALKLGKGGLAIAISQTNSCFQLIFEMIFESRIPNIYEVIAIAFAVIGAMIIAIVKQ